MVLLMSFVLILLVMVFLHVALGGEAYGMSSLN
jgi:hypothetical protein